MYTSEAFKKEICEYIEKNGYDPAQIAKKAFSIYSDHVREMNNQLREKLLDIANMDMGSEFELSEDEFKEFLKNM